MTETATVTEAPFTAHDRCDRCGAQAFVRTTHLEGVLQWCKHHFEQFEDKLVKAALSVQDNRSAINTKASVAAY